MTPIARRIILCVLLFTVVTFADRGERRSQYPDADDGYRNKGDSSGSRQISGSSGNQKGSLSGGHDLDRQSQSSGSFGSDRENDHEVRGNQYESTSFGNSPTSGHNTGIFGSDREGEKNRRPNQQSGSSGQFGSSQRPTSSGFYTTDHDNEFGQRPNQHGNSGQFGSSQRPNQQFSGSSGQFGNEYNQRPNQQFGNNQRPNQQQFGNNQRPNQQQFGSSGQFGNNQRPTHQQSGSSNQFGNYQETGHNNQRPNQQQFESSTGQYGNNQRPNQQQFGSTGQFGNNQRPNQQQFGSSGQFGNNQRPNQQQSGNNKKPNKQQSGQNAGTNPSGQSGSSNQSQGQSKQLCYKIFGCFSTAEPWTSKLRPIPGPLGPENNSAVIYFYSRPHVEQRYLINLYPEYSLGEAKFDPRKPTAIIIHGYIQDGNENWMNSMKNAYLKQVDANVMIVDWGKGSRRLSYLQASGNTRLIGRMVGYLIKQLMQSHGANPRNFHVIGHSLGAQIGSYIGKEVRGIGRLTALDPAQPGFEGFDKEVRLDKSDAEYVDVVHTSAKPFIPTFGLGMIKPYGHVDFYMNGGFDQPLCVAPSSNDLKEVKSIADLGNLPLNWFSQTFSCDHSRAYAYFIEALENTDCIFWGHKATAKNVAQGIANTLTQGLLSQYVALSTTCNKDDCVPLGLATNQSPLRGSFVVTTEGKSPYCRSEPGVPTVGKPTGKQDANKQSKN